MTSPEGHRGQEPLILPAPCKPSWARWVPGEPGACLLFGHTVACTPWRGWTAPLCVIPEGRVKSSHPRGLRLWTMTQLPGTSPRTRVPEPATWPAPSPGSVLTVLDGPGIGAEPFQPVIQSVQGHRGIRGARVPPESSQSPVTHLPRGPCPAVHGKSPRSPDSLPSPSSLHVRPWARALRLCLPGGPAGLCPVAVGAASLSLSFSGVFGRIPPGCEHV